MFITKEIQNEHYIYILFFPYSEETEEALFSSIKNGKRKEVEDIFSPVEWNTQTIAAFQNSVQSNTITSFCSVSLHVHVHCPVHSQITASKFTT